MDDILSYFKIKKNLINLLVFLVLILALPLGIQLVREQQIFSSRASAPAITFSGPNVETRAGKQVFKLNSEGKPVVGIELVSHLGPPAGTTRTTQSDNVQMSLLPEIVSTVYASDQCQWQNDGSGCWQFYGGDPEEVDEAGNYVNWRQCNADECEPDHGAGGGDSGPPPPSCTPDCSNDYLYCNNDSFGDGCGGTCYGTKDCSGGGGSGGSQCTDTTSCYGVEGQCDQGLANSACGAYYQDGSYCDPYNPGPRGDGCIGPDSGSQCTGTTSCYSIEGNCDQAAADSACGAYYGGGAYCDPNNAGSRGDGCWGGGNGEGDPCSNPLQSCVDASGNSGTWNCSLLPPPGIIRNGQCVINEQLATCNCVTTPPGGAPPPPVGDKPKVTDIKPQQPNSESQPYQSEDTVGVSAYFAKANHVDIYYMGPFDPTHNPSSLNQQIPAPSIKGGVTGTRLNTPGNTETFWDTVSFKLPKVDKLQKFYFVVNAHTINHGTLDWGYPQDVGCAWDDKVYDITSAPGVVPVVLTPVSGLSCENFGPTPFWVSPTGTPRTFIPPPGGVPPGGTRSPSPGPRSPSPGPAGPTTRAFKIAEDPASLSNAPEIPYTHETTVINWEFSDKNPGKKFIWVEFIASDGKRGGCGVGQNDSCKASIDLLGSDPKITSCKLDTANNAFILSGSNFGKDKGTLKKGQTAFGIKEWTDKRVVGTGQLESEGFRVALETVDGQKGEGACSGISQLALGIRLFCQPQTPKDRGEIKLTLVERIAGASPVRETVKVDKNGIVLGIKTKLEEGLRYAVSLKPSNGLRKTEEFTAESGTTNLPNLILPLGDIFPVGGDGVINSLDKSELNRQWVIGASAKGRLGDLNLDDRVNSCDWAWMRLDFGERDDPEATTTTPSGGSGQVCAQVITRACSPTNPNDCRDFPTPCDVPEGWNIVQ